MSLPNISSYGDYSSDNYGVNTLRVKLVNITLYYSYKTIVAYEDAKDGLVVRKNDWSTTTGKHLNWIDDDHKTRIEGEVFQKMLAEACTRHNI